MLKGKTQSGFAFEIDEDKLDDMDVLEYFGSVDDDMSILPKLIEILLGKEQKDKLREFVIEKVGKYKISTTYQMVMEILEEAGRINDEAKKE
jgi:hypothetical protein